MFMQRTYKTTMKLQPFVLMLVCRSGAVDLEINGEVSFDVKLSNIDLNHMDKSLLQKTVLREAVLGGEKVVFKVMKNQVTAGPVVECIYQYPEKEQVDAILSNMMNELTQVFVRAHAVFSGEDARRLETRFKFVDKKKTQFFDHIYHTMTDEYSKFSSNTTDRVDRSERDPCLYQEEIKQIWRELLDNSMASFRRAALRCMEEHLRIQGSDNKTRSRMRQFLMRDLGKVRSNHLHLLCDRFQLCFNELL